MASGLYWSPTDLDSLTWDDLDYWLNALEQYNIDLKKRD